MNAMTAQALLKLPKLNVIDPLNYEQILAALKDIIIQHHPESATALGLESTPESKLVEALAYYVLHERAHANQMALSLSLPHATGPELDNLGALPFIRTLRKIITPIDNSTSPPTPAVMESDAEFRERIRLALEGFSTAGSRGSYIYHALAAHPDIRDVNVTRPAFELIEPKPAGLATNEQAFRVIDDDGLSGPMPGDVSVILLSRIGDGSVTAAHIDAVTAALDPEQIIPLTDSPRVRGAQIVTYEVAATLYYYPGPSDQWPTAAASKAVREYTDKMHAIGYDVTVSGLHQALHQPGVQRVELTSPVEDIVIDKHSAAYCTSITINNGGVDV